MTRIAWLLIGVWAALALARWALQVPNGLSAEYFTNERFAGTPAVTTIDPVVSTEQLDAAWVGDPPQKFSARWLGHVMIGRPGLYTFATRSDDGSRLWIDDRLVVDNSGDHVPLTRAARVALDAGAHRLWIEYEQDGGGYEMALLWAPGDDALAVVPSWMLSPQRAPWWKLGAARGLDLARSAALVLAIACVLWIALRSARSIVRGVRRVPRAAALALFVALAVVETWPLARHPARLSRNDNGDTVLNEWVLAWVAHQAPRAPLHVYDANIFYPERHTLAYSESMIVQSAMGAPLRWLGASPVLTYNLVLLAGLALTGWAMCLVLVRWTGDWTAGLVSGVLLAFNSYTITSLPHLQGQHVEFLPPALVALDALLREPRAGHSIRLAIWFTLQALTSVYLLLFSAFALTVAALVRPRNWLGERFRPVARHVALAAAAAALALLPFLLPYWQVYREQGFSRTLEWQANMSASWQDYLTAPGRLHYALWSNQWFGSTGLFPGLLALALAGVAVVRRAAFDDPRARMCLAFGVGGVVLSFGPSVPGYAAAYRVLPPLHAIRAVSRFGYLGLFALAALAGFGVVEARRFVPARKWKAASILLVSLAVVEPLAAPIELVRFDRISPIYSQIAAEPEAVVAEMPFYGGAASFLNARYMLNSTAHWRPMVNGYSGFQPPSAVRNTLAFGSFPDPASVAALQAAGVTHVFVHADEFRPEVLDALAQTAAFHRLAALDGIILFRLDRAIRTAP